MLRWSVRHRHRGRLILWRLLRGSRRSLFHEIDVALTEIKKQLSQFCCCLSGSSPPRPSKILCYVFFLRGVLPHAAPLIVRLKCSDCGGFEKLVSRSPLRHTHTHTCARQNGSASFTSLKVKLEEAETSTRCTSIISFFLFSSSFFFQ